jgi:hypothetical protein
MTTDKNFGILHKYLSFELSSKMKEIGFKDRVLTYYEDGIPKIYHNISGWDFNTSFTNCISRPTYQDAFGWFRDNYGYWSYIKEATKGKCRFYIEKFDEKFFNSEIIASYEEAQISCLEKLCELLENLK